MSNMEKKFKTAKRTHSVRLNAEEVSAILKKVGFINDGAEVEIKFTAEYHSREPMDCADPSAGYITVTVTE